MREIKKGLVSVEELGAPSLNRKEMLRYMGGCAEDLLEDCLAEAVGVLTYKACYSIVNVSVKGDEVKTDFAAVTSKDLAKDLKDCTGAVIFAATVGVGIDRLISKYSRVTPARALCLQAIGSERVESLCDEFEAKIKKTLWESTEGEELFFRPRFSPGYGDLPLEFQSDVFRLLECHKHIGVCLGASYLMSPSKSVTAIIGFGKKQ